MLEFLFNVYFGISIFLLGGYFLDPFNTDSLKTKSTVFFILFFFGGILVLWEATFAQKFSNWFSSSEFGFLWKMYINKKYDNLKLEQIDYIKNQILCDKDLSTKDLRKLTKILKRNNVTNL